MSVVGGHGRTLNEKAFEERVSKAVGMSYQLTTKVHLTAEKSENCEGRVCGYNGGL